MNGYKKESMLNNLPSIPGGPGGPRTTVTSSSYSFSLPWPNNFFYRSYSCLFDENNKKWLLRKVIETFVVYVFVHFIRPLR